MSGADFPSFFCRFENHIHEEELICCTSPKQAADEYVKDYILTMLRHGQDELDPTMGTMRVFVRLESGIIIPFDVNYRVVTTVVCDSKLAS